MLVRKYSIMQKHISLVLFIVVLFVSCEKEEPIIYPENVFTAIEASSEVARACGTAFAFNNRAYITLGRKKSSQSLLNDCWEFNPTDNTWSKKQDFPGEGRVFPISAVVDDKVYVGLGYNQAGVYREASYLKDFWMYDPVTDQWAQKNSLPSSCTNNAVTFVYNSEIYVMHGFETNGFSRECWKYTPETDKWAPLADFPGRWRSCAVACTDGSRFFTGTGYDTSNRNDWWEYFPATDSWKKQNKMPDTGRINAVAFALEHRFFVATGGYFAGEHTGAHLKSDLMEYHPTENNWSKVGYIPGGGRENAISFILSNKVYIGFGENYSTILNDLWCFEP